MDRWLQTGTLKRKSNNKNETNSNIQHFLEEAASYSPPASNVSSSSGAHSAQTEWNVSKAKHVNCAKRRKYLDSYLSMGFTQDGDETSPRPVCILCNEVLRNSSMAPSKLKRYFETKRSKHKCKPLSFSNVCYTTYRQWKHICIKNSNLKIKMHLWLPWK
jgi:hypothetical protein